MGIREDQKQQRKQKILITALDLFVKKGYSATKISDISNTIGMSVGLLFHYFPSKEALYEELIKMGIQGTKMPLQIQGDCPLTILTTFVEQLLFALNEQPYISKMFVFMAQAMKNQDNSPTIKEMLAQVNAIEKSVPLIEQGQTNGTIKKGDPLALSNAFWCSIQGIMEQLAANPNLPFPKAEWIVDIIKEHA